MLKIFFIIFWATREIKSILFWIYLWQLKEYHRKRFIDHFRTFKGRSLFLNPIFGIKLLLLLLFLLFPSVFLIYFLLFIYFLEATKSFIDFYKKRIKFPVFTLKATTITALSLLFCFALAIFSFFKISNIAAFVLYLLIIDIFTILAVSIFVFLFQPVTLFFQYRLLTKARKKREQFKNLIVVGITGSYGKTSTKEMIAFILSKRFNVLKTEKHINAEVGIAKTILEKLKPDHQIFVVEMGAYERGKIKQVSKMVKPKIGVLTGINQQHMATFGTQENIIKGKFELMDALPEDGVAVVNWDNEFIVKNLKLKVKNYSPKFKIIKYGIKNREEVEVFAEGVKVEKNSISFWISTKTGEREFCQVNLIGGHNIYAILAGVCVAKELGMSLKEIVDVLKKISPEIGAMKLEKGVNRINIIDASYSANPDGVISALDYLKIWEGKKVIIMPCLIELGKASKEVHKKIGEKIAQVCDLAIITTRERFQEIKKGATTKGMKEENILLIESPKEIVDKIKSFCEPEDVILLEGRVPRKLKQLLFQQSL